MSIVFVAAECVHGFQGRPGITARAPWVVACTFGLPAAHIPMALLFSSVGEIEHFCFVGVVVVLIVRARHGRWPFPSWARLAPPYAIGSVAMLWLLQRVVFFWG